MAIAAVTPRVRTVVICDDVVPNSAEPGVFTLEGVRQHLWAELLPWSAGLSLFLLLSSPRKGNYAGKILVVNERDEKAIRYAKFRCKFAEDGELLPLYIELVDCVFPETGQYRFEVYFSGRYGGEALKAEHPFSVLLHEG